MRATFEHPHRVTYAECTLGNHIYYSRYLDILEAARGEFLRHLGLTFLECQEQNLIFPVIESRLRYKAPARYDDLLTVQLWLTTAQRITLNFAYRILNQHQTLLVEGHTHHVCTDDQDKPQRLPENLLHLLHPYVHPAENENTAT